ncbi:hypothetical protein SAMN05428949_2586 [Chitinophaga sp. YR627]|uniref:hypothetical protein n=1 Tax=Chitinophaga sp. YR627 TaxID=1881041 RepID=UPI0008DF9130|nr:hypothetical protein [Chitinophaga sp. YR627]SFN36776.1 hypothetical protein SAMN05428949_2586 [Chitinophaga sp. YR627]
MLTQLQAEDELLVVPSEGRFRFALTFMTLFIVLISIIILISLLFVKPFDGSGDISHIISQINRETVNDSLINDKTTLVKYLQEEKKGFRDFFLQLCQLVLLNLLLPIVTAVMAYRIGAKESE